MKTDFVSTVGAHEIVIISLASVAAFAFLHVFVVKNKVIY